MTTTLKGIIYGYARGDDWLTGGNDNFYRGALLLNEQWGPRAAAFSGLTYAYFGGAAWNGSAWTEVADGTIALTDNATNYVERTDAGTVSKNTTGFTASKIPMAKVTTVSGAITAIAERRREQVPGAGGGSGKIAQVVNTQTGAVATGSTGIPHDDTIPQNTEGDEYMTLAITPTSSSNKLRIDVIAVFSNGTTNAVSTVALFQDSTANALAAVTDTTPVGTGADSVPLTHYMTAGTTSATTFKVRIGANAGTITFNGQSAARRYGGVMASSITIWEIIP